MSNFEKKKTPRYYESLFLLGNVIQNFLYFPIFSATLIPVF